MFTICRSPSSTDLSRRRTFSIAAGSTQSRNGAPLRRAPGLRVDGFYFLVPEPGVEEAVCWGRTEGNGFSGEGFAEAHFAAENRDEAMLLNSL